MARSITDYNGSVHAPDSDYPDGDIKDNDGSGNGTYFDRTAYADHHQFFMKMMRETSIASNGLPDNEYNGYQLYEALLAVIAASKPYSYIVELAQNSTNPPSVVEVFNDLPGTLTWAYSSTGTYTLTYAGSISNIFSAGMSPQITPREGFATVEFTSSSVLTIKTYDASGSLANGLLGSSGFRIDFKK